MADSLSALNVYADLREPRHGSAVRSIATSSVQVFNPLRIRDRVGQGLFLAFCGLQLHSFAVSWLRTGRWPALVFAILTILEASLTVVRRPPTAVTRSATARVLAGVASFAPLLIRARTAGWAPDWLTGTMIAGGIAVTGGGLLSLARSFSIVASNRGVVQSGLYRWIRHPLYAGYLLCHVGFVIAYPTSWNLFCVLLADGAQFRRIDAEEELLCLDPTYRDYRTRVRWRLVPGVY